MENANNSLTSSANSNIYCTSISSHHVAVLKILVHFFNSCEKCRDIRFFSCNIHLSFFGGIIQYAAFLLFFFGGTMDKKHQGKEYDPTVRNCVEEPAFLQFGQRRAGSATLCSLVVIVSSNRLDMNGILPHSFPLYCRFFLGG